MDFWSNNDRGYQLKIIVEQTSQSVDQNTSTARVRLYLINRNMTFSQYRCSATINIDGQVHNWSGSPSILSYNSSYLILDKALTFVHDDEGNKTVSVSASFNGNGGYSPGRLSIGGQSFTFNNIPRASDISFIGSVIGQNLSIRMHKKVDSYRHKVKFSWYSKFITISEYANDSVEWTVPMDFCNDVPDSTQSWGTLIVETYNGNGQYLARKEKRVDLTVPNNVVPSFDSLTVLDTNENILRTLGAGNFLQNYSKIRCSINGATGSYGSTIVQYRIQIGSQTIHEQSATVIPTTATNQAIGIITDSRGRTATKQLPIKIHSYEPPKITAFFPARTGSGTNKAVQAQIMANAKEVRVNNVNKNPLRIYIERSERNKNLWSKVYESQSNVGEFTQTVSAGTDYDVSKSYDIRLRIVDAFGSSQMAIVTISTARVVMAWGKNNVGVGKVPDAGRTLDVLGDSFFEGSINQTGNYDVDGVVKIVGQLLLNGKPIQSSTVTKEGSWVYDTCPKGTDFGGFLKSTKVPIGFSVIRDNNTFINFIVIKENSSWIYGIGLSQSHLETVRVLGGIYQGKRGWQIP